MGLDPQQFSTVGRAVATGYADLVELILGGEATDLLLTLTSQAAGSTLTDFRLLIKAHSDSEWESWLGGADWADSTIEAIEFVTATDPATLAAEGQASLAVKLPAAWAFKAQAKSAAAATISIYGIAR